MVQDQVDYKVDASKLLNQVLSIFDRLLKICGVVMEDDFPIDQF